MSGQESGDKKICFCHDVMASKIRQAIRNGAHTLGAIQNEVKASTGCGGCEFEVVQILEEELENIENESSERDAS